MVLAVAHHGALGLLDVALEAVEPPRQGVGGAPRGLGPGRGLLGEVGVADGVGDAGGLFMVAVAVALLGLIPPRYTSSIQVLVDPSDLRVVENDVNARQPQADSGVSIAESQVRVIQSDSVLRRVIAKLHLDQDDEFVLPDGNNPTLTWIKGALGMLPPPASRDPVITALDTLQNRLTVRRAERTFVIDVRRDDHARPAVSPGRDGGHEGRGRTGVKPVPEEFDGRAC
ncbi:Wzz/FepE/Etk N-terminal domain-containing protein, partial [Methylobacterium organophilum]|nr:Wzz/FepE/Etk N-terminal domain-containing protein [Methylobacterium organophilum]